MNNRCLVTGYQGTVIKEVVQCNNISEKTVCMLRNLFKNTGTVVRKSVINSVSTNLCIQIRRRKCTARQ